MRTPTIPKFGGFGRDPFKIGLAAFAALGLLAGLVIVVSTVSFGTSAYHALLAHTGGLRVGESVQVAGVDSGTVSGITLEGQHVRVDFNLDKGVKLGAGSTADVKVATLLGTHYLAVDPKGGGSLTEQTIPLDQTSVPFNLQDVIDRGTDALDRLDSAKLGEALSLVADTLKAAGPDLLPALKGVDRISQVVTRRGDQIRALLQASRGVADQLSASSADLLELMRQTNLVTAELLDRRAQLHALLVSVAALSDDVRGLIRDTKADLRPALDNLHVVMTELRQRDTDIRALIHNFDLAARYIANAAGNGPYVELNVGGTPDDVYCTTGGSGC